MWCTPCQEGKYQDSSSHTSSSCKPWASCSAGQYQSSPPSTSTNRDCTACQEGKYQDSSSHTSSSCKPWASCPMGQAILNEGTAEQDVTCQDTNECLNHDCFTGRCVDGIGAYSCDCSGTGYQGSRCDKDINECLEDPCDVHNLCQNTEVHYTTGLQRFLS